MKPGSVENGNPEDMPIVYLRKYTLDDMDSLVRLADNRNVSRYLAPQFPFPYTMDDARWWIETGSCAEGAESFVIEYMGRFAGGIGITPQKGWRNHMAEIGYWLGEDYWGRGITTAALTQMCEYAFSVCGYEKLYAPVLAPNRTSMRVLEKCGFMQEGILKHEVYRDGTYYDLYYYARYNL